MTTSTGSQSPRGSARQTTPLEQDIVTELHIDENMTSQVFSSLDQPHPLQKAIERWASIPPVLYVYVTGFRISHWKRESPYDSSIIAEGSSREDTFSVGIPLSEHRSAVPKIRFLAKDSISTRALGESLESSSLSAFCQAFCAIPAKRKILRLRRQVINLDFEYISSELRLLSGFGDININLKEKHATSELRADQSWRPGKRKSFRGFFTSLFEKAHYDAITVEWPFAQIEEEGGRRQYVALSEKQWIDRWAPAIRGAVRGKRFCTLTEEDLIRYQS